MRKLGWMVLAALVGACGDDDNGKQKTPDAGPDGGTGMGGPGCDQEVGLYPGWTLPPIWNEANLVACETACDGQPSECLGSNDACVGADQFYTCVDEELYACQTSPGQDCRLEYEDWTCCAFDNCGTLTNEDQLRQCLQQNCSTENNTVEECYVSDTASPGFVQCLDAAYASCLAGPGTECDGSIAKPIAGYEGDRSWTQSWPQVEYDACVAECQGVAGQAACRNAECPGADAYRQCVLEETATCTTQVGGPCRAAWETLFCCASGFCSEEPSAESLGACVQRFCSAELAAFDTCELGSREGTCKTTAEAVCAVSIPDAGIDDAGTDAGPIPDGGPTPPSSSNLNQALIKRFEHSLRVRELGRGEPAFKRFPHHLQGAR